MTEDGRAQIIRSLNTQIRSLEVERDRVYKALAQANDDHANTKTEFSMFKQAVRGINSDLGRLANR